MREHIERIATLFKEQVSRGNEVETWSTHGNTYNGITIYFNDKEGDVKDFLQISIRNENYEYKVKKHTLDIDLEIPIEIPIDGKRLLKVIEDRLLHGEDSSLPFSFAYAKTRKEQMEEPKIIPEISKEEYLQAKTKADMLDQLLSSKNLTNN